MNKFKIGDKIHLMNNFSSAFAKVNNTLIIHHFDEPYFWCNRKGDKNGAVYCFHKESVQKLSNNPFVRIKRMFCRAFEC